MNQSVKYTGKIIRVWNVAQMVLFGMIKCQQELLGWIAFLITGWNFTPGKKEVYIGLEHVATHLVNHLVGFWNITVYNCCVFCLGDSSRKWTVESRHISLFLYVQFSRVLFTTWALPSLFQMVCYCWWQNVMIEHSNRKGTDTPWNYLSPWKSVAGTWPIFCGMTIFHGLLVS